MAVRNQNWYNANEQRSWPFEEFAQLRDDSGNRLPDDIIADLHLRFPSHYAARTYVSAITIGPSLITILICSADDGGVLASISVAGPITKYRQYNLTPFQEGVGGWIVFGQGTEGTGVRMWRFTNAEQSLLTAHTALKYTKFPVQSIGANGVQTRLKGRVRLQGGTDIETVKQTRVVHGVSRDVIAIRLKDRTGSLDRRILEEYTGDCGRRPESRNCNNGTPVELVNNVTPDCCGRIYVELRGGIDVFPILNVNGVILDLPIELDDACVSQSRLPDSRGRLPNEYQDQCLTSDTPEALAVKPRPVMPGSTLDPQLTAFDGLLTVNRGTWGWRGIGGPPRGVIEIGTFTTVNVNQQLMVKSLHRHGLTVGSQILAFFQGLAPRCLVVSELVDANRFLTEHGYVPNRMLAWLSLDPAAAASYGYDFYQLQDGLPVFYAVSGYVSDRLLTYGSQSTHYYPDDTEVSLPRDACGLAIVVGLPESAEDTQTYSIVDGAPVYGTAVASQAELHIPIVERNEDLTSSGTGTETLLGPNTVGDCEILTTVTLRAENNKQLNFAVLITSDNGDTLSLEISQQPGGPRVRLLQRLGSSQLVRFTSQLGFYSDEEQLECLLQLYEQDGTYYAAGAVMVLSRSEALFIQPVALHGSWQAQGQVSVVTKNTVAVIHNFNVIRQD